MRLRSRSADYWPPALVSLECKAIRCDQEVRFSDSLIDAVSNVTWDNIEYTHILSSIINGGNGLTSAKISDIAECIRKQPSHIPSSVYIRRTCAHY